MNGEVNPSGIRGGGTSPRTTKPAGGEPTHSSITQKLRDAATNLYSYTARKGAWATIVAIARTIVQPLIRYRHHFIWEAPLDAPRVPSPWAADEQFSMIGPGCLDREMNPQLRRYLGGDAAADDLNGVQQGDQLLVVTIGSAYVYSGYVYFNTTAETLRQKKLYGEFGDAPVIGTCSSTPVKIWSGAASHIASESALGRKLMHLLPAGSSIPIAAAEFKSVGQCLYTAQLSYSLGIPFEQLKARVVAGENLWHAVQAMKPEVDAMAEVRKAWDQASVHRRVLNDVFCQLKCLGYKRAINDVLAHNEASHSANKAVGMNVCRELWDWTFVSFLVVQRISESGRSRWRVFLA